jgi:hypothetical protein|tara:strand:+ start:122 stop:304 length:183 start_codon:yes stop_codon:yes gene_type:complete
MNEDKEIKNIFKKLEDPNFENQTSRDEREFLSLRERSNQNKMKRVRGLVSLTDAHKIERG